MFGLAAYGMWGLFPLYFPLLEPAGAVEILAHRIVWSLVVVAIILALGRRWSWLRPLLGDPALMTRLTVAALLITVNWVVYIWGVNHGHVVEASLGYFINPLVTVLLGVLLLHERLRPVQWTAVGIGLLAVVVLTVAYGRPPWIALVLAGSFAGYGLMKKQVGARVEALQSLAVETAVLAGPAAAYLAWLAVRGEGQLGSGGRGASLLLLSAGIVTAVPLLFFAAAARRVPLTTMGLLQYLTPVLQLLIGVLVYDEAMPPARLAGFALVWLALLVLSVDALRRGGLNRRAARG